ncbi:predicted protein [Uncinocarpus reesii 1704]|uniref:Uncharacterized protein n=1 Tax=Uncinocarpus reesii (strain UAMH 1704) TaxID=336963 RepID=C4JDW0_UNCRE|nr:uncharacterized protein UREG_00587 [Uncinocarpus reesii 1704]EEP75740.1 predicted protein [Uncinocarpus reesii 1704]
MGETAESHNLPCGDGCGHGPTRREHAGVTSIPGMLVRVRQVTSAWRLARLSAWFNASATSQPPDKAKVRVRSRSVRPRAVTLRRDNWMAGVRSFQQMEQRLPADLVPMSWQWHAFGGEGCAANGVDAVAVSGAAGWSETFFCFFSSGMGLAGCLSA